jgi:hypothetical protein
MLSRRRNPLDAQRGHERRGLPMSPRHTAADYLVKPVDRAKLVETLTSICGSTSGCALLVDDDDVVRRSAPGTRRLEGGDIWGHVLSREV